MSAQKPTQDIRTHVRERYGQIAAEFKPDKAASCCDSSLPANCCSTTSKIDAQDVNNVVLLYENPDVLELPTEVTGLSLGCGDPVTLATLKPGQTVLDLGSGGGIDCFLAARQVGPNGRVIGIDMTPAMLEKARANQKKLGLDNVEFRLGEIEHLPVADNSVDVIISNCVINLSPDKKQVFREAWRVLRPSGRLAVSDIVTDGPLPDSIKSSLSAWAGCIAGALDIQDYIAAIQEAGFTDVDITPVYLPAEMIDQVVNELGEEIDPQLLKDERAYKAVFSAKITALKPPA